MRIRKAQSGVLEGDLTPMIDMTFQLIAFFMVLINFTQTEQHEDVTLPKSELAKPPEGPIETPITVHLTANATAHIGERKGVPIAGLGPYLSRERTALTIQGKTTANATIVIRAHQNVPTGRVQELIKMCQDHDFEKFALRAEEDVGN